ncbi:MAG: nuclear transport factor 2 family protein [Pseudomonadota bacterium]
MSDLELQMALIDNYNRYAQGLDFKDWGMVRSCFADEVYIDYGEISAPTGSPDVARKADDWLEMLKAVINGFDLTQHTITNHRVDRDGEYVSCRAYLTADHVVFPDPDSGVIAAEDVATVVGEYTNGYTLVGGSWKICRSQLNVRWSSGNVGLFVSAPERAARRKT